MVYCGYCTTLTNHLSELDLHNLIHVLYPKDQGAPRVSMAASDNVL